MSKNLRVLSYLALALVDVCFFSTTPTFGQEAQFTVSNYQQISQTRVSLYVYQYVYVANVSNNGGAADNVVGAVTSTSSHATIVSNTLSFGTVAANSSKLSLNSFSFQQDLRYPFAFSELQWTFASAAAQPPIANAGPAQTLPVGSKATLNGSQSSDPNGVAITEISWTFSSKPPGSAATLSNATTYSPSFVLDVAGNYVVELTVTDALGLSGSATVTISTSASAPVANAGASRTVPIGTTVTLNGSGSTDADGAPMTFAWSFVSIPGGSAAVLNNPTSVDPTFTVDKLGNYVVQLIVSAEGLSSAPSQVTISTTDVAPVANAGPNQTVLVGATVSLNGSGSSDLSGNPITFAWSFVSLPTGSSAVLSNPTSITPSFKADRVGSYMVQLIVNDGILPSAPATVTITTNDVAPVANAGPNQTVLINTAVILNGANSTDSDGNPLTYSWALTVKPTGSKATLANATTANPTFTVDTDGTYVAQLIVNDGFLSSAPATVTISTTFSTPTANAGANQTVTAGSTVQLDGSKSSDPDGSTLTYSWSILSKPSGSAATLSNASIVNPTFGADLIGTYLVQLTVTSNGLVSAPSTVTITSTTGTANKLVFTVQPSNVGAGVSITPAVAVTIEDGSGNIVTTATNAVSIAISNNPASGTLAGTLTATPVNGVATFSNLSINNAGTGYTLAAAATGLASATSSAFNVTAGTATKLVFTVQPSNVGAGASITPAVAVTLEDGSGNIVTTATNAVTIAISNNPTGGTLAGTVTATPVNGVATFSSLSINKVGTGYTLAATATGLTSATSSAFNVTAGTAARLVFTVQPSNVGAGASITPAVAASIEDGFGNIVTTATNAVSIAISNNPASGTLAGTLTATPVNGVATFSNLSINNAGTGYTLAATATGLASATSSAFNVTAGTATKLVFTVQPSNVGAGASITPAVAVTIEDGSGNIVTTATNAVSIAISNNPASGTLAGTLTATPVNGVATFSNLSINNAGTGYTLAATATGLASATSSAFNVTAGTATKLVFTVQPSNVGAGASITPAVAVTLEDGSGNIVTTATNAVTIAISNNPTGGTLAGTVTATPVNGVATFSSLSINKVGTGYTLAATAAGLTSATSSAFNVTAGTAAKLVFTVQPSNVGAGASITPAVAVSIEDGFGNIVTTATNAVSIAISNNPASGTLAGTLTATPVNGVATFSNLSINNAGTGYTLAATATGLASATSSAFNVTAGTATKLVFTVQPSNVGAGASITPAVAVTIEDGSGNIVTTATNAVSIAISNNPASGTLAGTLTATPVNGVATFSNLSINNAGTGYTLAATATGLASATSSAFNVTSVNTMSITTAGGLVGLGRSIVGTVTVSPAPTTSLTVNLTSGTPAVATVSPASIVIAAGTTTGTFSVNGVTAGGPVTLQATATGYPTSTTSVTVTSSEISLATGLVLAPAQTSSLAFSLSTPAPAGGVTVNFVSSNTAVATVTTSVFVPAGAKVASTNPQVTGVTIGSANITASATGFAPDTQSVQVTVTASVTPTSLGITATRTGTVQLNISAAAPPPSGITFSLSSDNTAAATVPASVTIPAGNLSAQITVTGVAAGSANLTISSPGVNTIVVPISVVAAPAISLSTVLVGNNMIAQGSASIPVPPTSNESMTLTVTGANAADFLLTSDSTKAGASSITLPLTTVSSSVPAFFIEGQNYSGTTAITATLTASAPGYANGTTTLTLYPSGLLFFSGTLSTTSFSTPSNLPVYLAVLSPGTLAYYTYGYPLGPQASPIPVTITSTNTSVGTITGSPSSIPVGSYTTNAINFQPVGAGSTNLNLATPTGYSTGTTEFVQIAATVTAPAITVNPQIVGNNLIAQGIASLGAAPPTSSTMTLTVTGPNSADFLLTADPTKVGTSSISLPLTAGSGSVPAFYIEGRNYSGTSAITATLAASAPGFTSGTTTLTLYPSGLLFFTGTLTTTSFSTPSNLPVYLAVLSPGTLAYYTYGYALGPQASAIPVTITSTNTSVGTITGSPSSIPVGSYTTSAINFQPVGAGSTNLNLATPTGYSTGTTEFVQIAATVTAPAITVSGPIVGNNMIAQGSASLAAAPPSSRTMTLAVTGPNAGDFLLTADPTKVGSSSLSLPLTAGSASVPAFYIEGQNYSGTAAITATLTVSATGFTTGTTTLTLYPSGVLFFNGTLSTTTFSTPSSLPAYLAVLSPGTLAYYTYGSPLGPQAAAVPVAVSSSNTTVGTITGSPASIPVGSYTTSAINFQPATAGTANLNLATPTGYATPTTEFVQIVATVTAPAITVNLPIVGNNTIVQGSVSLQAAPPSTETMTITTTDSTHFLLTTDPTKVGTASITLTLTAGSASVPAFYVEGQNLSGSTAVTATLTAKAAGFSDGTTTLTLYPSGLAFFNNTLSTTSTSGPTAVATYLVILSPNTLSYYTYGYALGPQASAIPVVITSSNTAVGTITGSPATIAVGTYTTSAINFQPATAGTTNLNLATPTGYNTPTTEYVQIVATVN